MTSVCQVRQIHAGETNNLTGMATFLGHYDTIAPLRVVLASQSSRRLDILRQMGCKNICVIPSTFAEDFDKSLFSSPEAYAQATAQAKGLEVAQRVGAENFDVLIAADTIVVWNGQVIEKPKDSKDAYRILQSLSGLDAARIRHHDVITAVAVVRRDESEYATEMFTTKSRVWFGPLTDRDIQNYIATGEPFDKAGAYGIQGLGGALVERIDGCFYNIQGLPLYDLSRCLATAAERMVSINNKS